MLRGQKIKILRPEFFFIPSFFFVLSLPGCSGLFYHPDNLLHYPPEDGGFPKQEIKFQSSDGTKLLGWFFSARNLKRDERPLATVIQFHGNGENMSSHYISLIWMTYRRVQLFVFDYRGYGASEGKPNQEGTYWDGLAALSEAWKIHKKNKAEKFIVIGQSLGGAIAMRALEDFGEKSKTDLLVMDSTFVSYQDVARRKLAGVWWLWPFSPLAYVLVSDSYSAEEALKKNNIPLLVLHDKHDPAVPFAAGEEIFEGATAKKDFWTFEDGRHVGAFAGDKIENRKRLMNAIRSGI